MEKKRNVPCFVAWNEGEDADSHESGDVENVDDYSQDDPVLRWPVVGEGPRDATRNINLFEGREATEIAHKETVVARYT